MSHTVRRMVSAAGITAAVLLSGITGPVTSARADAAPTTCDQAALDAAVVTAAANERVAQKLHGLHPHLDEGVGQASLKADRVRKAKQVHTHKAVSHKGRKTQNKHAARVKRMSKKQLLTAVKAERARLKAAWDAAKKDLKTAQSAAAQCKAAEHAARGPKPDLSLSPRRMSFATFEKWRAWFDPLSSTLDH